MNLNPDFQPEDEIDQSLQELVQEGLLEFDPITKKYRLTPAGKKFVETQK